MSQFTSVAIAVVEHEGRFLVGKRSEFVPLGGYWEFPGGKLQVDESPREAAERECLEETGIAVEATHCLVVNLQQYEHGEIKLHFLACQLRFPDAAPADTTPTLPFKWVSREELASLRFPVGNRPLLQRLLEQ